MPRIISLSTAAVVLLAAPTLVAAQTFTYGKADDVKDVETTKWEATAEAGLVVTTGNSQTITLTGGAKATRRQQQNKFSLEAAGTFARASNTMKDVDAGADNLLSADEVHRVTTTSAESYNVKLRYDRFLTKWDSLYLAALGGADIIAGKDFVGGGQVGYARTLYKTEKHEVTAEIGYDFSYEDLAAGDSHQIHSGRGFLGYQGKLSAETSLAASLEALDNVNEQSAAVGAFEDLRAVATAALSTKVTKGISVSLSFTAKYDNAPAPFKSDIPLDATNPPENSKLDTTSKASLIVTLL